MPVELSVHHKPRMVWKLHRKGEESAALSAASWRTGRWGRLEKKKESACEMEKSNKDKSKISSSLFISVWPKERAPTSHWPRRPAGKARCCWRRRSRTALWLCGCRWSCAVRWNRPTRRSPRVPRTRWAERPSLGWWALRCWRRRTATTGCCWRMTTGNWWETT